MQTIKRRIGIFMHQFDGGGAERMTVILANALYEAGHEVTFIVRSGKGAVSYTHLDVYKRQLSAFASIISAISR